MHHQIESVASVKQTPWTDATLKRLQQEFLELVPHIRQRARFRFRAIRCPGRHADMVAEAIALGWKLYLRLHERGIDLRRWHRWFTYIAAQLPVQHRLAGIKRQDVLDRLNRVSPVTYCDAFLDDRADIPDMVAFKLDWQEFREQLSPDERMIVDTLAECGCVAETSRRLGIPPGRVFRRRSWIRERWDELQPQD